MDFDTTFPLNVRVPLKISETAYDAGDVVGGLIKLPIKNPITGKKRGVLRGLTIIDTDGIGPVMSLHIFADEPTVIADNAPLEGENGLKAADFHKLLTDATLFRHSNQYSYYATSGVKTQTFNFADNAVYFDATDDGYLYLYLVTHEAVTWQNDDALYLILNLLVG